MTKEATEMAGKVIVLVADRDDPKHGEVTVLVEARKAERLVETLLEAGFERERIRIFKGSEMEIEVTHRPVVSLVGQQMAEGPTDSDDSPAEEEGESEGVSLGSEAEQEGAPVGALVQNGVRFSSLFRNA